MTTRDNDRKKLSTFEGKERKERRKGGTKGGGEKERSHYSEHLTLKFSIHQTFISQMFIKELLSFR